jgi:RecA/RadA recombinase
MGKKDDLAEKRKNLHALMNKINEKEKKKVIAFSSEVPNPYFMRYPTGCMQLDVDIGGGFPAGGMSTITGPDGAGKTALLFLTMAMHQRIFGHHSTLGLAPIEFLPDYFFMRHCGVKVAIPDEMIDQAQEIRENRGMPLYTKDEIKELKTQIGEFYIIRGETGEAIFDTVLECYASKEFGIIGVDGVNSFISEIEAQTESIGDTFQQGQTATILTKFCHKFHPMTLGMDGSNPTALITTGQVRANRERANAPGPMQKYIKQYTETLPWAMRHARLLGLMVWPGEKLKETKGKEKGEQIGRVMNWETLKGKAGTHDGIRGEADFSYEKLLDSTRTIVQAGFHHGVLKEEKGLISILRPENGDVLEGDIAGVDKLIERMQDLEFELSLRNEILAAAGKMCIYR